MADGVESATDGGGEQRGRGLPVLSYVLLTLVALQGVTLLGRWISRSPEREREAVVREAMDYIQAEYVREPDPDKLLRMQMHGLMRGLGDPWSRYLDADSASRERERIEGSFVGIGVVIREEGVVSVLSGSPADKAGVKVGDVIGRVGQADVLGESAAFLKAKFKEHAGKPVDVVLLRTGAADPLRIALPGEGADTPKPAVASDPPPGSMAVGYGIRVGRPYVLEVRESGPAEEAGMQAGDVIVRVEKTDTADVSLQQLVKRLRGVAGSKVAITVQRGAEAMLECRVTRAVIKFENVSWRMRDDAVGVLTLRSFSRHCPEDVESALKEMTAQGMKALVLDLRYNPGGLVLSAVRIADMLLPGGRIYDLQYREETRNGSIEAESEVVVDADIPVAVLVGRNTASAAEILAGALQANKRAQLVGVRTVGKGAVTQEHRLRDGSAIVLVVAYYRLANGHIVEENGLTPDVECNPQMPHLPARLAGDPVARRRWQQTQLEAMAESVVDRAATLLKERMNQ